MSDMFDGFRFDVVKMLCKLTMVRYCLNMLVGFEYSTLYSQVPSTPAETRAVSSAQPYPTLPYPTLTLSVPKYLWYSVSTIVAYLL